MEEKLEKIKKTRAAGTRDANSRIVDQRDKDYYRRLFQRENIAKTYIPEDLIPKDYEVLWVRLYTNGVRDDSNIRSLKRKKWELVRADSELGQALGSSDIGENIHYDSDMVIINEMALMIRPKYIHELEIEVSMEEVKRKDINNFVKNDRNMQGMQPFSVKQSLSNLNNKNAFYSTSKARELSEYV